MTNNPTIDGVSLEDLEAAVKADASRGATASQLVAGWAAMERLRVFLAANNLNNRKMGLVQLAEAYPPHPYGYTQNFMREEFERWAAEESEVRGVGETIGLSTDEHHDRYSMIWTQTSWMAWQASQASMQSTIAQLQERVAEMESGRGDVIHQVRTHGSDVWEDISGESLEMCQCQPEEYEIRKLYTAPPAPVAVALPDDWQDRLFAEMERRFELPRSDDERMVNDDTQIGVEFARDWIEACLDATAALNGAKP